MGVTGADLKRMVQGREAAPSGAQLKALVGEQPARRSPQRLGPGPEAQARFGEGLFGLGETGLAIASGAAAEPIAGLMGLGENIRGLITGEDEPLARAAATVEAVREGLTFEPRTAMGREVAGAVGRPFQALQQGAQAAGGATLAATGSPLAATGVQTALEVVPGLAGARGAPGRPVFGEAGRPGLVEATRTAVEGRRQVREGTEQTGVEPGASVMRQREQLQAAAEREAGGVRGEGMEQVRQAVLRARAEAKATTDRLYQEARRMRAGLPVEQAVELPSVARAAVRDFDIEAMPVVQRRLADLDRVREMPPNSVVRLNAIEAWRQRLNRNRPAASDRAQNAALDVLAGEVDNFLTSKFNADMISGDPAAIARWREARQARRALGEQFEGRRGAANVIRQITENTEATPETLRRWVFGASAANARAEAGAVVRRLKEMVGEDSPEFRALRQEALLDIMDPLLRERPNVGQFVRNYDRLVRNNRTLTEALFPESSGALKQLRDRAAATSARQESRFLDQAGVSRGAAVAMFGHGLARAALKVSLADRAFRLLRRTAGKGPKRRFMGELLGYDPFRPLERASGRVARDVAGVQAGQALGGESEGQVGEPGAAAPGQVTEGP